MRPTCNERLEILYKRISRVKSYADAVTLHNDIGRELTRLRGSSRRHSRWAERRILRTARCQLSYRFDFPKVRQ